MPKKIIFRLDDYSHECNHTNWIQIIDLFNSYNVKVCIGVIPDSKDQSLIFDKPLSDDEFWNNVRLFRDAGHTIALHGLHHTYHKIKKWLSFQFFPINDDSEFVSLSVSKQTAILKKSYDIFKSHGVFPNVFMAPSHSFDTNTLTALKNATPIRIITDGYYTSLKKYKDFIFVPSQVGSLRVLPFDFTCICLHPNTMSSSDFDYLNDFLISNKISDFDIKNSSEIKHVSFNDKVFSYTLLFIKSLLVWVKKNVTRTL